MRLAAEVEAAAFVDDADLQRHIERDRVLIESGSRVILVAHSQGNPYANAVQRELAVAGSGVAGAFGLVGVATPASEIASPLSPAPYTTLHEDVVIAAVRNAFPSTKVEPTMRTAYGRSRSSSAGSLSG